MSSDQIIIDKLGALHRVLLAMGKQTLTIDEAADYCGYEVRTMQNKVSMREIPHFKCGRQVYFDKQRLEDWMRANPVPSKDEIETMAANHKIKSA